MSPDQAEGVTEADLIVDGQRLNIMTITHVFSLLWTAVGAGIGGGGAWGLLLLINRIKKSSTQSSEPTCITPVD